MDGYSATVGSLRQGGMFVYPIVALLVFALAVYFERWLRLAAVRRSNRKARAVLMPLVRSGRFIEARALAGRSDAAIAGMVSLGLSRLATARHRDDVRLGTMACLTDTAPQLARRMHCLGTFAGLAILLALPGTIVGLARCSALVAGWSPADSMEPLSASLSMMTSVIAAGMTAAGLLVLVRAVLRSRAAKLVDALQKAGTDFLDSVSDVS
jgi:biopolymer transport protein ExbB/TolQ